MRLHLTPFLWLVTVSAFGQVNLKAGYALAALNAPNYDAVISAHNDAYAHVYNEPFPMLDFLHGLDLGVEYRWETVAIEAGWRVKRNRQEAKGTLAPRGNIRNNLTTSLASFYTGLVQYYGPIRIAGTIDYSYVRMKMDFQEPAKLTVLSSNGWSSQFSAGVVFGGKGSVSLVISPFVQVSWTDYGISELRESLSESVLMPAHERFLNYGVTLLFLNGPR